MENRTVEKGQNLLEDFVWPIDTGRLIGDPKYLCPLRLIKGTMASPDNLSYEKAGAE